MGFSIQGTVCGAVETSVAAKEIGCGGEVVSLHKATGERSKQHAIAAHALHLHETWLGKRRTCH